MGRNSKAAAVAPDAKQSELVEPTAVAQAQPARWSIQRMLAVSAVISAALWGLITFAVIAVVD